MLLFSCGNIICFPVDILQTLENVDLLYIYDRLLIVILFL